MEIIRIIIENVICSSNPTAEDPIPVIGEEEENFNEEMDI